MLFARVPSPTLIPLREMGCNRIQGYSISRPKASDELEIWLRQPQEFYSS